MSSLEVILCIVAVFCSSVSQLFIKGASIHEISFQSIIFLRCRCNFIILFSIGRRNCAQNFESFKFGSICCVGLCTSSIR